MKKQFDLENFLYLTIFLLPAYLIKLDFLGGPTNLLELFITIAFAWAIFLKLSFRKSLKPSFSASTGLIFFGLLISVLVNKNYLIGFGIIKGWFLFPLLLALTAKIVIPEEKRKNIYLALYCSAVAVAVASLTYYIFGQLTYDGRLQGIFNSPNYLAMYLAPAVMIGAISVWQTEDKNKKIFFSISLLVIGAAFYLTYSYAAWAAVILTLLILESVKNQNKTKLFKNAALFLVLVGLVIFSQWNSQKFQDLRSLAERSSLQSRLMIWNSAWKIGQDNWLWGIGPGNFQSKYLEYQKYFPPYLEWAVPHPHSLYLAIWLYSGLIGTVGFLALQIVWFKEIIKKEKNSVWFMAVGLMLYFLLHGLVDTTYFKNDLAAVFWLNLVVLL